jgi:N-acetyl sugar amidotransferase
MAECKQCLYSTSHPFGLTLNEEFLCSGCRTHREKSQLNWDTRWELLRERISNHLKGAKSYYDCVVPIRGTAEYYYVLDVVKGRLNLNPLVVYYNSQFNSIVGIKNIDTIRHVFDVDFVHYTSNPHIYKKLIRESLVKLNSMRWPFIAGDTQFPVQIAVEKKIPLIIWPYHQPTEQVGMHSYLEENQMTRYSRHEFDLMGVEPHEMVDVGTLSNAKDIEDLNYPSFGDIIKNNIIGIYLSNYMPWDSRKYAEEMIHKYGAFSAVNHRTFDTYDRVDDMTYMTIHDLLKYGKLGYSRVTDNLSREIRFGRISRIDAKIIEKYYQGFYPEKDVRVFLDWLGMSSAGLGWYLKRLPYQFIKNEPQFELNGRQKEFISSFITNCDKVHNTNRFITFGKGLDL